ncbi:DUF885 family protein [Caulobacter sp. 17J80-11]|uniref:DUF885 domain-containing protein n=1 Tax=Caulobacter sp. 17J80-11 TaxID=2763502 RepID=UPI001653883E|nr:DUF885 domain-containing protein [Caulobacter sp. 17J80-11]MBC6982779.1 DUF885 domain-containing protein [Caulobacter sp. 17J80-11]
MLKSAASALAILVSLSAAHAWAAAPAAAPAAKAAPAAQTEDQRLAAFFDATFKEQLALSPEGLTQLGSKDRYGELGDYTLAGEQQQLDLTKAQLERMKREFDYAKLCDSGKLSYRLYEHQAETSMRLAKWRWQNYAVSSNGSALNGLPVMLINSHRVDSVADAEAYISRLKAMERVGGEIADDLDARTAKGFVSPSFVYKPVIGDTRSQIEGAPFTAGQDVAVWADFKKKVEALKVDPAAKAKLLADGEAAMKGPYKRGFDRVIASLENASKSANSTDGVWRLPDGDAYYADTVRFYTTTDLTPAQIHDIGLSEVARIHKEMEAIKDKVGFKGTLAEFFTYVKTDPKFHYPNTPEGKQQYLADATAMVATYMKDAAGKQFSNLPKGPLEVKAVEPWREATASVAFYNPGTPDGSRPGIYYVNLSDMNQVLKPQIEAITYHEGTPGHHFQLARSLEQADLPMFRRLSYQGAYIEGWGLYAEKLGKEAGFYQDPYSDFGRLSLELWRAGRLVVDTGIHAKHWSRDQAMQYFRDNTLLSERDVAKEIDRYITNPGQATSYKIGQLKILELREKAKAALGPKFDLKAFHEVVLANGALPLDVLTEQVDAYIAKTKGS